MHRTLLTTVAALGAALVAAVPALAKDGDVLVRGTCSAGSAVKLKLSDEDGRIEAEMEVDHNRAGVRWRVSIARNGVVLHRTTAVTTPRSGSFEVRRVIARSAASTRISGVATSPSGERCAVAARA